MIQLLEATGSRRTDSIWLELQKSTEENSNPTASSPGQDTGENRSPFAKTAKQPSHLQVTSNSLEGAALVMPIYQHANAIKCLSFLLSFYPCQKKQISFTKEVRNKKRNLGEI